MTANDTVICNKVQLGLGGGTLFQAANRSHIQSMMYMIETPEGKTVFIDSGNYKKDKDGQLLYELIQQRGGLFFPTAMIIRFLLCAMND